MFELYRPSSAAEQTLPEVVYPNSLFSLGLGYALWYPEPHDSGEPQIGDVGYVRKGAFIRFLNINTSKPEHNVTFWGSPLEVPDPLPEDVFRLDRRHAPLIATHYISRGVQKREMQGSISTSALSDATASISAGYSCKETQGALLVLQSEAHSEAVFDSRKMKTYMLRQHERWFTYVRDDIGHDIRPEEVVLISGWAKTSADWATTAFSNSTTSHYVSLQGQVGKFIGLELFRSRSRAQSGLRMHRQGLKYPRAEGTPLVKLARDQCIFVMRYKVKRRFKLLKKIVAGAGYNSSSSGGGRDAAVDLLLAAEDPLDDEDLDDGEGFNLVALHRVVDPLDTLLEYILEVSGAEVAIARDEDIYSLVGGNGWPIDFATYLRKVQPPVEVEDRCGTVSISDLIAREQLRKWERRVINGSDVLRWPGITYDGGGQMATAPARLADHRLSHLTDLPKMWTYLEFRNPSGNHSASHCLAISEDSTLLAAAWEDSEILVWRLTDGITVQRVHVGGPVGALAFCANGKRLVAAIDTVAIVYDLRSGNAVWSLEGHQERINDLAYSRRPSRIVTCSQDGALKMWNADSGAPLCSFDLHLAIKKLVFSPDGSRLAAQQHSTVTLYDAGDLTVQLASIQSKRGRIISVAFAPQGDRLFVSDESRTGRIYDSRTCKEIIAIEGHSDIISSAAFAPGGRAVATASRDCSVSIRSSSTGTETWLLQMKAPINRVGYSPNGDFIAAADDSGRVGVWRALSRRSAVFIAEFQGPESQAARTSRIEFLPDSRCLLTATAKGAICLWDVGDVLRVR